MNLARYRKAILAAVAVIVLAGQLLSDGHLAADELGQLVAAAAGALGVFGVENGGLNIGRYSKVIAALVGVAGVVGAALADGNLQPDEIGQLVGALLTVVGIGAVANATSRPAGGTVFDSTSGV
jgi:hypothetical protein